MPVWRKVLPADSAVNAFKNRSCRTNFDQR